MERGAWWVTVQGGHKESDTTERLSTHTYGLKWLNHLSPNGELSPPPHLLSDTDMPPDLPGLFPFKTLLEEHGVGEGKVEIRKDV